MSKSIKLKNNTYIDSKGVDYKHTNLETTLDSIINKNNSQDTSINNINTNITNINNELSRVKIVDLCGAIKTPSIVTLNDYVQNYDFILIGMTSNYYDHYQYMNILGYGLNGLYDWRNQRLAYFDGDGKLVYNGYCHIYDNKFDGTGLTLDNYIHITWIRGVKL